MTEMTDEKLLKRIASIVGCTVYGAFSSLQEASQRAHKLSKATEFQTNRDYVRVGVLKDRTVEATGAKYDYYWAVV